MPIPDLGHYWQHPKVSRWCFVFYFTSPHLQTMWKCLGKGLRLFSAISATHTPRHLDAGRYDSLSLHGQPTPGSQRCKSTTTTGEAKTIHPPRAGVSVPPACGPWEEAGRSTMGKGSEPSPADQRGNDDAPGCTAAIGIQMFFAFPMATTQPEGIEQEEQEIQS